MWFTASGLQSTPKMFTTAALNQFKPFKTDLKPAKSASVHRASVQGLQVTNTAWVTGSRNKINLFGRSTYIEN